MKCITAVSGLIVSVKLLQDKLFIDGQTSLQGHCKHECLEGGQELPASFIISGGVDHSWGAGTLEAKTMLQGQLLETELSGESKRPLRTCRKPWVPKEMLSDQKQNSPALCSSDIPRVFSNSILKKKKKYVYVAICAGVLRG